MEKLDDEYIKNEYVNKKRSMPDIAKELGTYTNKIKRILRRLRVKSRDRSESQKIALKNGRKQHPTVGKKYSQELKNKIGDRVSDKWNSKSKVLKQIAADKAREYWQNMPQEAKDAFFRASNKAIRETSIKGSKLERKIYECLTNDGFVVEYHKDRMVENQKLQVDMLLPEYSVALEIDGPSHFLPIWGQESLEKNIKADTEKNGLLLHNGFVVLRVKNTKKNISEKLCRDTYTLVKQALEKINKNFPDINDRLIEIEV